MSTLDQQVGAQITILAQVIADVCQQHTLDEASDGEISRNQFRILKIANNGNDLPASEIARIIQISTAAASKNIDRLVALGLITREPVPADRRRHRLTLTDAGHGLLQRYDDISATKLHSMLSNFTDDEKTALTGLLQRVLRFTLADERDAELVCLQCGGTCGEECVLKDCSGSCYSPNNLSP